MVTISIRHNFPQVQAALAQMHDEIRRKALASAINKTLAVGKTHVNRRITAEYKLTASYVRRRLSIRNARARQSVSEMYGELIAGRGYRRSANVIHFDAKEVKGGVRVRIRRSAGSVLIPNAFIGKQGELVFQRKGKYQYPIKAVQTIDVGQMFNKREIKEETVRFILERFPEIFKKEAAYWTKKFNQSAGRK